MKYVTLISSFIISILMISSCSKEESGGEKKPEYHFEQNVGTIDKLPQGLSTYQQCCAYASAIDGFLADSRLYSAQYSTLNNALTDYNVPVATADVVDSKAKVYSHAKKLMDKIIVLDTHSDFAEVRYYNKSKNYTINESQSRCQTSIERMHQGHQNAQYLATWMSISGSQTSQKALDAAPATLWEFYDYLNAHILSNSSVCGVARNRSEVLALRQQGKVAFLYGLENAFWTGTDLLNLDTLVMKGYTYVTLSHNGDNQVCHSALKSSSGGLGLTEFGSDYVKRMNELGLVIDLSHTSDQTCWDVMNESIAPVVFTHSGAYGEFAHARNVNDDLLKKLKDNGGVIQVYLVQDFMASSSISDVGLNELVDHINHCVAVAGIDHVGVGIDLDGGGGGVGYNSSNDAINLTVALINEGYSDEDIAKIWGENYFRVLDKCQSLATRFPAE